MKRMERSRVLIVRFSVDGALAECRRGGKVEPQAKGHAMVVDQRGYTRGFLTTKDYATYLRRVDSGKATP